ncbi:MAG: hypothetical protein Q8K38_09300 [Burkholderiaceae bacterium]|nr:hypothetical protein [Burkholderiaceae bacterium]MDZ4143275.1 hypothetical protein [Burkholderiales bacterium]
MLLRQQRENRRLLKQRPDLVRRFVRIFMLRKAREIGQAIARRISRSKLLRSEKKRTKALVGALEACGREALRARRNKLEASEAVFNLALYFLVAERDIQAVKVDALTHPDSWRRSLYARLILLTIHELELDKAGGTRLRKALEDASVPEELRQEVAAALRSVRSAQQKAQKQFAALRHSTIAHRDADAIAQYRRITELDSRSVIQTAAEFYTGTQAFMEVMPRLLGHVGGMSGLISQFIAQNRRGTRG